MGNLTSNLVEVVNRLRYDVSQLGMHGRGRYKRLGQDIVDLLAEGVYEQTVLGQKDPNGNQLAPLAKSTLDRKRRLGYPETILVETGKMLSMEELRGFPVITRSSVRLFYGKTEEARLKATYAHEGSRRRPRRPKRKFWGLNEKHVRDLDILIPEALDKQAQELGCV